MEYFDGLLPGALGLDTVRSNACLSNSGNGSISFAAPLIRSSDPETLLSAVLLEQELSAYARASDSIVNTDIVTKPILIILQLLRASSNNQFLTNSLPILS
ncbi:MAG: hypothetical protein LN573_03240 [Rickettsia endosymbiont of Oxypoda opaca]|nr:hypothetical protein [Rickettsia endosymbiont of Oxypoda opaca]